MMYILQLSSVVLIALLCGQNFADPQLQQTTEFPMLGAVGKTIQIGVGTNNTNLANEIAKLKNALSTIIEPQFIQRAGYTPDRFDLVSYGKQVVAGFNYFCKVRVSETEYVHLRVFEPLPYTQKPMELHGIQLGKTLNDPIAYFEPSYLSQLEGHNGAAANFSSVISLSNANDTNDHAEEIANLLAGLNTTIKDQYCNQTGGQPDEFNLVSYAAQPAVHGINYFCKVRVNDSDCVHLRIYKVRHAGKFMMILRGIQTGKSLDDPITYFEPTIARLARPAQASRLLTSAHKSDGSSASNQALTAPAASGSNVNNQSPPLAGAMGSVVSVDSLNDASNQTSNSIADLKEALQTVIKAEYIAKTNSTPSRFDLVSFASQVVAGTNFFCKVRVGDNDYAHLRVFKPLPFMNMPMELDGVQRGKVLSDPVQYFEQDNI